MKKNLLVILFCIVSFFSPALIQGKIIIKESTPKVLVSVAPYAYFVEKIAGKTVEIQILVPPGANAHLYEPVPKEIEKMLSANLWMRLGDPFEKKLVSVLKEKNPSLVIVELWEGITLLGHTHCSHEGHDDEKDFHIWMSPKLAKLQAEKIASNLTRLYPQNRELYQKNLHLFLKELTDVDHKISALLKPLKGKALLVSHPAFGYFCKDYDLIQIPVEFEGKEPRPKQISQILQQAETLQVKTVLTQAQYSNKGAELIAEKLHLPISLVDPYSMDYSKNLLHLAEVIANPK